MDKLVDIAQKGFDAYNKHNSDVNKTGGEEYNSPHNSGQSGYGSYDRPHIDDDEVIKNGEKSGSGDSSLFSSALGFLKDNKKDHEEPVDDEELTRAHDKVYNKNDSSGITSKLLGSAAALEVIKKFTGGSSSSSHGSSHGSSKGGNSQTQLISMAMSEAAKLFDKSGGKASGNKQDAVNGAAMTVMKLLVQSKFSGSGAVGGKDSGGLSSLMSLASKFSKH
ncbi:hypothetical protein AGABI1DRAFT_81839 [Agaricus bisporus var. burnettii JB137-S8]|uniref:DUF7721 domain-containing protein n=1 Tax=Agaricus bisporus var. burnettii (strain JB137-S8 / ATCC MYA-4627 / FGSC 10392) TaxID=597362 RepID=K5X8A7_AGABU|nr:uncharacterized protein AGABI1DRAFT_81839 [Agaricus bisporus var. burnettii JB137-S8]EKM84131.1 hypothetical protein AGABI1DRAFT_81839 [Agaricus bisporus var. burnettii JB137-S8]